ncbi:MAG: ribosome biogenesis GTPase Der [Oscillospiraceae bacterium]|jgi:GTP-binding protein|nr:ribosome biogenesis GTPase Der [Oscillospiraceae bacterium]
MAKPVVAIIGRPNVGKSTLFNKLIGKRHSIIHDTPGVTRDRVYENCEWTGKTFLLVDTGGIEFNTASQAASHSKEIFSKMLEQAKIAIKSADAVIFVTDIRSGIVATDNEVAALLRKSGKFTIVCVNKCDNVGEIDQNFYEFYNLGLGDPMAVSSVHGHGTGDLLDRIIAKLPISEYETEEGQVKVAIIGKPNVGKSSLINKIAGEERSIISEVAGTTRDSIDCVVENQYGKYCFVDTAGLRKKSKVNEFVEKYSVIRTIMAIERSDVCVILIDAVEGISEQDVRVAGLAYEAGKGCAIAVNKWDSIEKNDKTMQEYRTRLKDSFAFMSHVPCIFISAKTGLRLETIFSYINQVASANAKRISTGKINAVLADAIVRVQPPSDKGRRLKIYYMTQISAKPPKFVLFVNSKKLFHFSYQRYLENRIRDTFKLQGTAIKFIIREKRETASRNLII